MKRLPSYTDLRVSFVKRAESYESKAIELRRIAKALRKAARALPEGNHAGK